MKQHLHPVVDFATLTIIPSYRCQSAHCKHCYQKTHLNYAESCVDEIDIDALMIFLREYVAHVKLHWFGVIGGEVTDYPRCGELISRLTSEFPGIRIEFVTNGQNPDIIVEVIEARKGGGQLAFEFSLDGMGAVCDMLRGKRGYFESAIHSIERVYEHSDHPEVHVNARYFPEHETSLIELSDFLAARHGLSRRDFSLMEVAFRENSPYDEMDYLKQLREFCVQFWQDNPPKSAPRAHRDYRPYDAKRLISLGYPGIHPDGYLYTCYEYAGAGLRVGHISDLDVLSMIGKMLRVAELRPYQCDECLLGKYVRMNYEFQNHNAIAH